MRGCRAGNSRTPQRTDSPALKVAADGGTGGSAARRPALPIRAFPKAPHRGLRVIFKIEGSLQGGQGKVNGLGKDVGPSPGPGERRCPDWKRECLTRRSPAPPIGRDVARSAGPRATIGPRFTASLSSLVSSIRTGISPESVRILVHRGLCALGFGLWRLGAFEPEGLVTSGLAASGFSDIGLSGLYPAFKSRE